MDPIRTTLFDSMRLRDTKFSAEMARAITMMKDWCGSGDSGGGT